MPAVCKQSNNKEIHAQVLCKLFKKRKEFLQLSCKTRMMVTLGAPQVLQTALAICILIVLLNEYISQVLTSSIQNFELISLQQTQAEISMLTMESKSMLDMYLRRKSYGWRILQKVISGNASIASGFSNYPFVNLQSASQLLAAYDSSNSNYIVWFSNKITNYADLDSSSRSFLENLSASFFSLILEQDRAAAQTAQTYAWQLFISQNSATLALLIADPLKLLRGNYEKLLLFFENFGFNSACTYSTSLSFNLLDLDPRCFQQFSTCEGVDSFVLQPILLSTKSLGICSKFPFTTNQDWISFSDFSRVNKTIITSNNSMSSAFRDLSTNHLIFSNTSSSLIDWLDVEDNTIIEKSVILAIDNVVSQQTANQESSLGQSMAFSFSNNQNTATQLTLPIEDVSSLENDLLLFISAVKYNGINLQSSTTIQQVPSFWHIIMTRLETEHITSMNDYFERNFYHVLYMQMAISLPLMTLIMLVFLLSKLKKIVGAFVESIDWTIELMNIISGSDLFDSDIDEAYVHHFFIRYCLNTEAKELLQTYFILILKLIRSANNFFCEGQEKAALERYQEAQVLFERLGNQCGIGICKNNIGNIHYKQGNLVAANNLYQQSYQIAVSERDATESKEKNHPRDNLQQDIIEQLRLTVANRALQVARTLNLMTHEKTFLNIGDQQISQSLHFEEIQKIQSDASVRGSKISTDGQFEKLREKAVEFYSIAYNYFIADKSRRGFSQIVFICVNLADVYLSLEKFSQCQGMIAEAHRKLEACICLSVDPRSPFQCSAENFKFLQQQQTQQQIAQTILEIPEAQQDENKYRFCNPNKPNNKATGATPRSTVDFGIRKSSNRYRDSFPELQSPQFLRLAIRGSEQQIEASMKDSLNQQTGTVRSRGDSLIQTIMTAAGDLPQPPRLQQASLFQKLKPNSSTFNPFRIIKNKLPTFARNKSSSMHSALPIRSIISSGAKLLETASPIQKANKNNFSFNLSPTNPNLKITGMASSSTNTTTCASTFHFSQKFMNQIPQNSLGTSIACDYGDCKEVADKEEVDKDENDQISLALQVNRQDEESNQRQTEIFGSKKEDEELKIQVNDICEEKEDEGGSQKVDEVSPNIETSILKHQRTRSPRQQMRTQELLEDPSPTRREELNLKSRNNQENDEDPYQEDLLDKFPGRLEEQFQKKSNYRKDSLLFPMISDKTSLMLGSLAKKRVQQTQSQKDELFLPYSILWMKLNLAEGRLHKSQERYLEAAQCFVEVIEHREGSVEEDFSDPKDRVSAMVELISVLEQLQMIEQAQELRLEMNNMKQLAQRPLFMIDSFC